MMVVVVVVVVMTTMSLAVATVAAIVVFAANAVVIVVLKRKAGDRHHDELIEVAFLATVALLAVDVRPFRRRKGSPERRETCLEEVLERTTGVWAHVHHDAYQPAGSYTSNRQALVRMERLTVKGVSLPARQEGGA
jgi:membrane protein implicated in regulation of membrane protease activity